MSGQQVKKADLVAEISEETGVDRKSVTSVIDSLSTVLPRHMQQGNSVMIAGIGKFFTKERPERTVRNPATGETKQAPADRTVRMTIAKALKDSVK